MSIYKRIADAITVARALLALVFVWLGATQGVQALPLVAWLMMANWTGDALDGRIARLARHETQTWIGGRDLEVDMLVGLGLLIYMTTCGFVAGWLTVLYCAAWLLYFARFRLTKEPGELFQTPVYFYFAYLALRDAPVAGVAIVAWVALALAITWPEFPRRVIPEFIEGMRHLRRRPAQ